MFRAGDEDSSLYSESDVPGDPVAPRHRRRWTANRKSGILDGVQGDEELDLQNAPLWCIAVQVGGRVMKNNERNVASHRKVRASISLSPELHEGIERIARAKKVSIAWVVRDAVEKYLESEKPVSKK